MSAKNPTQWTPEDSGTVTSDNADVVRVTKAADTRVTRAGDTRVIAPNVVATKNPTDWSGGE